jgi:hypothetical protein
MEIGCYGRLALQLEEVSMTRKRALLLSGVVGVVALLTWAVPAAIGLTNGASGGPITQVKVKGDTSAQTTTSTSFVNLTGASVRITVPRHQRALILARFSAETDCTGGSTGQWCSARILIGGVEASPASGVDFAMDSVDADDVSCDPLTCGWESHSMDRSRGPLGPGTYTVRVQWRVNGTPTFRLDDWSLTVERVKVG